MYLFYTQCIGLSAKHPWIMVVSKVWVAVNDVFVYNIGFKEEQKFNNSACTSEE